MITDTEFNNPDLESFTDKKSSVPTIGLVLFLLPGILILIVAFFARLGQINPFLMLLLFLIGGIFALIGFIVYLIAEKVFKKKIKTVFACFVFYILLLPIIWGVNGLKERIYIHSHQELLENVANDLLTNKITIEVANEFLKSEESILNVICVPDENKHVLFLLDGLIDNCYGLSYSLNDKEPSQNCCGDLIKWKKIKRNWYKWGTT